MFEKNKKPLEAAELTDGQLEQAAGGGQREYKMSLSSGTRHERILWSLQNV